MAGRARAGSSLALVDLGADAFKHAPTEALANLLGSLYSVVGETHQTTIAEAAAENHFEFFDIAMTELFLDRLEACYPDERHWKELRFEHARESDSEEKRLELLDKLIEGSEPRDLASLLFERLDIMKNRGDYPSMIRDLNTLIESENR